MVDVTVRGAGIFGLSVAWACSKRGAKVVVVDPKGPGAGASGGLVGALAPHVPENWNPKKAFQLESLLMAEAWWAEVGPEAGYARLGRVQPLEDIEAVALARLREDGAKALWGKNARWEVTDRPGDWAPPSRSGVWVKDTLSARIHPRRATQALAAKLDVVAEAPDQGAVIWATGWEGLRTLSDALGKEVGNGVKGQAALLDYDAREMPQIYADGLHIVPHADGTVAVGSTSERVFDDPDDCDDQLDALLERVGGINPALQGAPVLDRWAGVRPRAKSRAPMLGRWPERDGHFVANGGFKIGFGMAPKVGEVMADLILDGSDAIPEGFRVEDSF